MCYIAVTARVQRCLSKTLVRSPWKMEQWEMKNEIRERVCGAMNVFYLGRQTLATFMEAKTVGKLILMQVNMRRHGFADRRTKAADDRREPPKGVVEWHCFFGLACRVGTYH